MSQEENCRLKYTRRVATFVEQQRLFAADAKVLVAISGGADSVALLHILLSIGYQCHAVHCNFHLRGEESIRDEQFVTTLCSALKVPCEVVHFDTQNYAAEHKLSIEMAARELRYNEFERIRHDKGLDIVAVAHHQDDAVETLLLNLIRGAGINGLTGIRMTNGYVVRPLLCLTRDEIIDYLDYIGQPYVTDSTNLTDEYARNKVRLGILPLMEQINPAVRANIARTAAHINDAAYIYNKVIGESKTLIVTTKDSGIDVDIAALMATETAETILFEILNPYGFNARQISDIYRGLIGEAGRVFYSEDYIALKDRSVLSVRPITACDVDETEYMLPDEGILALHDGTEIRVERFIPDASWSVPKRSDILCLDAKRIKQPLVIRRPRQADRFQPFGMKGTKLLSDFYTDLKLSRFEKNKQWLLCQNNEIVWAIGLRSSECYRITHEAKEIIQLTQIKV